MSKPSEASGSWSLGERSLADDPTSAVLTGADVAELQGLLGGLGYQLPDDGRYGPTTADQVREFQKDRRLRADGVFGPARPAIRRQVGVEPAALGVGCLRNIW